MVDIQLDASNDAEQDPKYRQTFMRDVPCSIATVVRAFGGKVVHASTPIHGKTSPIVHDGRGIFRGLPTPFRATRYHSLCAEASSLPACLEPSAWSEDGVVMGVRHRDLPLEGVQFHPESILTEHGDRILGNFLDSLLRGERRVRSA